MTPLVLVHGGSFAASCWDLLVEHTTAPTLAVDLPGRGKHPAPPHEVNIASAARSIVADIDAAGFEDVVLVGHSLAGVSLPSAIKLLGARVRHAVFVACTVPRHGQTCIETLPEAVQEMARAAIESGAMGTLDRASAQAMFGNDLDDAQFEWMMARMVAEPPGLLTGTVDLSALRAPLPRTWIRPTSDAIVDPVKQLEFAGNVGDCEVIDLDAGHMCMISRPAELAALLDGIAGRASG